MLVVELDVSDRREIGRVEGKQAPFGNESVDWLEGRSERDNYDYTF